MAGAAQLRVYMWDPAMSDKNHLQQLISRTRSLIASPAMPRTKTIWQDWFSRSFLLQLDDNSREFTAKICSIRAIIGSTPGWMHPDTDLIASFPPFNNQPTQYRISVDGEQKWFAQCGFEALACRWLFAGKTVRVDAPCLLGDEPLVIEMRDEEILSTSPNTIVGYTRSAVGGDAANRPFR